MEIYSVINRLLFKKVGQNSLKIYTGAYPVTLTATDYLGHTTDVELEVTVE